MSEAPDHHGIPNSMTLVLPASEARHTLEALSAYSDKDEEDSPDGGMVMVMVVMMVPLL